MSTSYDPYKMLEFILKDIISAIKPSEEDSLARFHVINEFRAVIESVGSLRGATVEPFGSFVSHLYSKWSDLDISVEVPSGSFVSSSGKKWKLNFLKDILRALKKRGDAHYLQFIPNARVPLLVYKRNHNHRNISCDISINNLPGQIKSKFLFWITQIDDRFHDMVLLVKEWAKAQNINDPKAGTLNSYSLCLLVIFHFQTCVPAILPPLMEIYAGNIVDDFTGERVAAERRIHDTCAANLERFRSQSIQRVVNRSSLSELFVAFFEKFSRINSMASEYAICTYTGRLEHKVNNSKWMDKKFPLLIEDPFEQPDNAARAVSMTQLIKISNAFEATYHRLILANNDRSSLIASLTRAQIRSLIGRASQEYPSLRGGRDLRPYPPRATAVPSPSHNQLEVRPSIMLHDSWPHPPRATPVPSPSHNQLQVLPPIMSHGTGPNPQRGNAVPSPSHNESHIRPSIMLPHNRFRRKPQEASPSGSAAQRNGQVAPSRMMWKPRDTITQDR